MIRLVKDTLEEDSPERTYPEPIPAANHKYWTTNSGCDTLKETDCDSLDYIEALEASKSWERLKIPIVCSVCSQDKVAWPLLDQFHWRYLHCTECPEFFVCGDCLLSQDSDDLHDEDHECVVLQTRPFASPTSDGSELQQLELFKEVQTANDFFLYFPWFFHCFQGMDMVREHGRATLLRHMLHGNSDAADDETQFMVNCLRFPVDWYLRCFGAGNWKMLHRSLEQTVDARIQVANVSTMLNELLVRLRGFVEMKESCYGKGNIPPNIPSQSAEFVASFVATKGRDYLRYTFPLHFLTILDKNINQDRIRDTIHSDPDIEESNTNKDNLRSAGNYGLFEGISHMSNSWGAELRRLWPIFKLLFEEYPEFKALVKPRIISDLGGPFLEYMKPNWQKFLIRDYTIRKKLFYIGHNKVSRTVEYLHRLMRLAGPVREELRIYQRERLIGNFEETIRGLQKIHLSDPEVLLEVQLACLEQGYMNKALDCRGLVGDFALELTAEQLSMFNIEPNTAPCLSEEDRIRCKQLPLTLCLLDITSAYAACFVRGAWEAALETAENAFTKYCASETIDTLTEESDLLRVRIELMSHKIVLETYRDLGQEYPAEDAAARLHSIWKDLCGLEPDSMVAEVAWEALSLELEMRKRTVSDHYFEAESSFSLKKFVSTPAVAAPLLTDFISSRVLDGQDLVLDVLRGRAQLLLAELHLEIGDVSLSHSYAELAKSCFKKAGCVADLLDVAFLDARIDNAPTFSQINPIYQELRSRNDMRRLRRLRRIGVAYSEEGGPELEWQMYQREALRELAREAGDNVTAQRWSLRKYAGDYQVAASVLPAEAVLGEEGVQSTLLATLASFNLSKAYMTLGNYFSAALNAMLHLSLVNATPYTEDQQSAILEVLRIFTAMVTADPLAHKTKLPQLPQYWNGWLDDTTLRRWNIGAVRCDEIDRFIDGACFLPLLAGQVSRWEEGVEILAHSPDFERALIGNLRLAFDLYEACPTYLAAVMIPKLSLALGATAAYIGNPELAIRCYWVGICCCHSDDFYTVALLRVEAGKQMTLLAERDPEHWLHLVSPGRSLLHAATDGFRLTSMLSGTILRQAEANLYLLRSYVAEARARKMTVENQVRAQGTVDDWGNFAALAAVARKAQEPLRSNDFVFDLIATNLELGTPHEFSENLARLAENPYLCETRQLSLELALIVRVFEAINGQKYGQGFWDVVQRSKGTVLGYHYGRLVPSTLLDTIQASPEAWRLYADERRLIEQGPQYMSDNRLLAHRAQMAECEELQPLLRRRSGRGVSMSALSVLVNEVVGSTQDVVMIDWIRYRDFFCLTGYNARTQELTIFDIITSLPITKIEEWVAQTLRVNDSDLPRALNTSEKLKSLWPLIAEIHKACNPGDILIFCPSKVLNFIPLHAIPYKCPDDQPIIHYHPIVYAPNNTVLKECVERALRNEQRSSSSPSSLRASFFCRYPENQQMADTAIREMWAILEENKVQTTVTSGPAVTQGALKAQFTDADLLHLHGHTAGHDLERHLVLETEGFSDPSFIPGPAAQYTARTRISPFLDLSEIQRAGQERMQRFSLQDAFAVTVRARLVMLMGCGSGIQVIREGDDALGLVNAFLSAGATSVMATLWPLDQTDAAKFSKEFYRNIFAGAAEPGSENGNDLIDLATAFQKSVNFMRACTRPRCLRKSLSARLQCHGVAPYHWAPFILSGSWVCRGLGVEC